MKNTKFSSDYLIIGAGAIGVATGIALLEENPRLKILIAEKELEIGKHASGRNSGVIHAGFYYSPDSLKAKFCKEGNAELKKLATKHDIPVRQIGKVVVVRNELESQRLGELFNRGVKNGIDIELLEAKYLRNFEPLAVTFEQFIWSPTTAVSDPKSILNAMKSEFESRGGSIVTGFKVSLKKHNSELIDTSGNFSAKFFINAAGAQSDRIARNVGVGLDYAMVPFMGVYRVTNESNLPLRTLVYPVPHPINPFLGVHFTLTTDGKIKIGPTAIPTIGREQYSLTNGWSLSDLYQTIIGTGSLIKGNAHSMTDMIRSEMPKLFESIIVKESKQLVPLAGTVKKWSKKPPGIRAQLVHIPTGKLEQDFKVVKFLNSVHILNAVSPGWTCSVPFGRYVAEFCRAGQQ
jgi:(S)-2-hydroxyglutarate dehydrogenase